MDGRVKRVPFFGFDRLHAIVGEDGLELLLDILDADDPWTLLLFRWDMQRGGTEIIEDRDDVEHELFYEIAAELFL